MKVQLQVVSGPLSGTQFIATEGFRIGRSTAEIALDDAKVSGIHAKFELNSRGNLVLVDQGSSNGIKVNGSRVRRVAILRGVTFQVGQTTLQVLEIFSDPGASLAPEIPLDRPLSASMKRRKLPWKEVLGKDLVKNLKPDAQTTELVSVIVPIIRLEVIRGPQLNQVFTLGYGPRRFGSQVLDSFILEQSCPPVAFELFLQGSSLEFKTEFSKIVLLNNQNLERAPLKNGDQIKIGQTILKVSQS